MKKMSSDSGFALVEVIIAAAVFGIISLGVMQMTKTMHKGQGEATGQADLLDMRREASQYLQDEDDCSASLKGVTFKGSTIKLTPKTGLEIWTASNTGVRSQKRFYETQKFGKINISEISLTMPDYTTGSDWPAGTDQFFKGELKIVSSKLNLGQVKNNPDQIYNLNLTFNTNGAGLSTIESCTSATKIKQIRQGFCTPALTPDNGNTGVCSVIAGYNLRRISACIPGTQRTLTCCYVPTNHDSNGWCSDRMEGHGGCFTGCGASDTNYEVQRVNGMSSGMNDTHTCCFIPKDNTVTKPFTSGGVNSWDSFSGCTAVSGYNVMKTNVVTGGTGNQTACTYVPIVP
jgi:prepilin-type N-terminal cleavage/methylation domain-containing protein